MRKITGFIRNVVFWILYGMTVGYAIFWFISGNSTNALYGVICYILALLMDILIELKKINDKN